MLPDVMCIDQVSRCKEGEALERAAPVSVAEVLVAVAVAVLGNKYLERVCKLHTLRILHTLCPIRPYVTGLLVVLVPVVMSVRVGRGSVGSWSGGAGVLVVAAAKGTHARANSAGVTSPSEL